MQRTPWGVLAALMAAALGTPSLGREPPPRGGRQPDRVEDIGAETATHEEVEPLEVAFGNLTALRLTARGNLLAADSGERVIKVINPAGKVFVTLWLDFGPEAIEIAPDGILYCGGQGKVAKLDKLGNVVKTVDAPGNVASDLGGRARARSRGNRVRMAAGCSRFI